MKTTKTFLEKAEQEIKNGKKSEVIKDARCFIEKLEKLTQKELNPSLSFKQKEYIERLNLTIEFIEKH